MSFLSDLFHGNFSNLGNDLFGSPTAIAETLGAVALPFAAFAAAPAIGGALGLGEAATGAGAIDAAATGGGALGFAGDVGGVGGAGLSAGETADASTLGNWMFNTPGLPGTGAADVPVGYAAGSPNATVGADFNSLLTGGQASDTPFGAGDQFSATGMGPTTYTPSGGTLVPAASGITVDNPATGGALTAGAGGAAPDSGGFLSTLGANTVKMAENPAALLGLGGLGYNLYQGYQTNQQIKALGQQEQQLATSAAATAAANQQSAQPLISSGTALMDYLKTNTLPPQFQASVDQQVKAAKAAVVQGYATRGMAADPKKNSALAQDLANVDEKAQELKASLESTLAAAGNQMVTTANQLLATGLNATQLAAQIPMNMQRLSSELSQAMASSIANFAAALNGGNRGGGTQTLKITT